MNKFKSATELTSFATSFANIHLDRFKKDIAICCTADANGKHAYFPALMACLGVLDLFSGLDSGKMGKKNPRLQDLQSYAKQFMPAYSDFLLAILYCCFRHKVAHMAHPYDVFDTNTKPKEFPNQQRMLITWIVDESDKVPSIELEKLIVPESLTRAPSGWNVIYDHVVRIHIRTLSKDIVNSIVGSNGYLEKLNSDSNCRDNFEACMNEYFPT